MTVSLLSGTILMVDLARRGGYQVFLGRDNKREIKNGRTRSPGKEEQGVRSNTHTQLRRGKNRCQRGFRQL
jgi:hypothetical protein